jgi:LysM repeat protein
MTKIPKNLISFMHLCFYKLQLMIRVFIFSILFFCKTALQAQNTPLLVQLDNLQKPYLIHTVGAKENFYSIGRMYNISPSLFLAPYNGIDLKNGLSIGQSVRVPLIESNFWQSGSRKGNETVVPVYHVIQAKETLSAVSKLYNTDKASLLSWNAISGEKINVGENIIIGFLKVDKTLSPLATQGMGPRAEPNLPKPENNPQVQNASVKKNDTKEEEKKVPSSSDIKPKEAIKKEPVVVSKPEQNLPKPTISENIISYKGKGFFEADYKSQVGSKKDFEKSVLTGGLFKSTSGWSDGKFYILIDGIEKGKIIQLTNLANRKVVYVKVLASISETKPGAKELFLVSNATAAQLEVAGNNFELEVTKE